jgi:hypothetical protein
MENSVLNVTTVWCFYVHEIQGSITRPEVVVIIEVFRDFPHLLQADA